MEYLLKTTESDKEIKQQKLEIKRMELPNELTDTNLSLHERGNNRLKWKGLVSHHVIENKDRGLTIGQFFERARPEVETFLKQNKQHKVKFMLECKMHDKEGNLPDTTFLASEQLENYVATNETDLYNDGILQIDKQLQIAEGRQSSLNLTYILELAITLSKHAIAKGSSSIKFPITVVRKGVINIQNKDDKCFAYLVTLFLNAELKVERNPGRVTLRLKERVRDLNWEGVEFPTPLNGKSILNFEKNNNRPVLVIGWDGKDFVPLRQPTSGIKGEPISLFFMEKDGKTHYGFIPNLGRALGMGLSSKHARSYICTYCLCNQQTEKRLKEHVTHCSKNEPVLIRMPEPGSFRCFRSYQNVLRNPFVIFCDFETYHKKVGEVRGNTQVESMHVPLAFSVVCVSTLPEFQPKPIVYCGKDAHKVFLDELEGLLDAYHEKFKRSKNMIFGKRERDLYWSQNECYSCKKEFGPGVFRVRDHNHFTVEFRGLRLEVCVV